MAALRWNKKRNVISETLRRSEKVRPLGLPCNSSPRYFAAFLLNSDTVFLFPFVRVHILCFPSSYLILSSTKNPIVLRSSPSPIFFLHQENFLLYFPPPPIFSTSSAFPHICFLVLYRQRIIRIHVEKDAVSMRVSLFIRFRIVLRTRPEIRPRRAMYHLIDSKLRVTVSNHCLASCIHPLPSFSVVFSSTRRSWINLFHLPPSTDEWGSGVWLPS